MKLLPSHVISKNLIDDGLSNDKYKLANVLTKNVGHVPDITIL